MLCLQEHRVCMIPQALHWEKDRALPGAAGTPTTTKKKSQFCKKKRTRKKSYCRISQKNVFFLNLSIRYMSIHYTVTVPILTYVYCLHLFNSKQITLILHTCIADSHMQKGVGKRTIKSLTNNDLLIEWTFYIFC